MTATDSSLLIRPAVDADGPALADLIRAVFAEYEDCPFVAEEFPELARPATHYGAGKGGVLWVAERTAQAVTSDDPAESRRVLAIATAAVEEVVKFIAPGEDEVPAHAFWSDLGRRERDAEPARFTLDRLLEMRRHYREQMRRYPTRKAESN